MRARVILIVGAGLFGATCAYELTRLGYRCVVIEKRSHVGGNCYTERRDGIDVHSYGPHIFHTSNKRIWEWINQFAAFNRYTHRVKVTFQDKIYSFPPNLLTFNELWGVKSPAEAQEYLERAKITFDREESLESWALSRVGREVYEIFVRGYTQKQWGRDPSLLPASIIKRIPLRFSFDDNYFHDEYQGIPIGGYTQIFEKLLSDTNVMLNTDYLENRREFDALADAVLFTGRIDSFYGYRFGSLEYLTSRFTHERLEVVDFQGVAQMNYTSAEIPYTRIVEHKHFTFGRQPVTWISKEYPLSSGHDMYPVRDDKNVAILARYESLRRESGNFKYYFGGRLAEYQYYDMHQVIAGAWKKTQEIHRCLLAGANARSSPGKSAAGDLRRHTANRKHVQSDSAQGIDNLRSEVY